MTLGMDTDSTPDFDSVFYQFCACPADPLQIVSCPANDAPSITGMDSTPQQVI